MEEAGELYPHFQNTSINIDFRASNTLNWGGATIPLGPMELPKPYFTLEKPFDRLQENMKTGNGYREVINVGHLMNWPVKTS